MPHHGETLQEAIKQSGVPISRIVQELGITRPTIYRKFREETLDDGFVKRVGEIIGKPVTVDRDTSDTFPGSAERLSVTPSALSAPTSPEEYAKALISLQTKYIKLLEDYNALLVRHFGGR